MELHRDKEVVFGNLDRLHNIAVRRSTADQKTGIGKRIAERVVKLITVTVPLGNLLRAVPPVHLCALLHMAGISAQTECAAHINIRTLLRQKINHLMRAHLIKFAGIRIRDPADVTGKFNHGNLHAKTYAQIGNVVFPAIPAGFNLSFHAAVAESARNHNAVAAPDQLRNVGRVDRLGINPFNVHVRAHLIGSVTQRLGNR